MTGAGLEFRVLAGPNIGASLALGAGRLVVGSGEEADVILGDATVSPSHLELSIGPADGGGWIVRARPLDGVVRLDGETVPPEGLEVASDQVLTMGFSALAYRPPEGDWGDVSLVPLAYARALVPEAAAPEGAGQAQGPGAAAAEPPPGGGAAADGEGADGEGADGEGADIQDGGGGPAADVPAGQDEASPAGDAGPPEARGRPSRLLAPLLVILAVALLVFSPAEDPSEADRAGELSRLFSEGGFPDLEIRPQGRGWEVSGTLDSDAELSRLVELAKSQPAKVFLRIGVRRDVLEAARQALASYGFYPSLHVGPDGRAVVSAYMMDREVEDRAFEDLARDVPSLDPVRRIVHRDRLEPILRQELAGSGLGDPPLVFRPGRVELAGRAGPPGGPALAKAFQAAAGRVGAPVVFVLTGAEPVAAEPAGRAALAGPAGPPPPGPVVFETPAAAARSDAPDLEAGTDPASLVDVAGITLSPMRFVSTRDGQRLFEGSPLSGGWTLSGIEARSLTLTRGDETVVIELGPGPE